MHRLEPAGFLVDVLRPSALADDRREERERSRAMAGRSARARLRDGARRAFALGDDDALFVIGCEPAGRAARLPPLRRLVCGAALSLSSMPRLRTTPNGFNEWLICAAIDWAHDNGFERVSLNFAPFAALLAPEADLRGCKRCSAERC